MNRKTFLSSVAGLFGLSMVKKAKEVELKKVGETEGGYSIWRPALPASWSERYEIPANEHRISFRDLVRTQFKESDYVVFPKAET